MESSLNVTFICFLWMLRQELIQVLVTVNVICCGFFSGPSFAVLSVTCVNVLCLTCWRGCRVYSSVYSFAPPPCWGAVLGVVPLLLASALLSLGFMFQEWTWPLIPSLSSPPMLPGLSEQRKSVTHAQCKAHLNLSLSCDNPLSLCCPLGMAGSETET